MQPPSEAKRPIPERPKEELRQPKLQDPSIPPELLEKLNRMTTALQKSTELLERHLAAGEKTVPARALYFVLRDAGFGTSQSQKQEVKQTPKQQQPTNELHHNYGMRR
jgi:hypothetical protein